jgi:hypothetical protein
MRKIILAVMAVGIVAVFSANVKAEKNRVIREISGGKSVKNPNDGTYYIGFEDVNREECTKCNGYDRSVKITCSGRGRNPCPNAFIVMEGSKPVDYISMVEQRIWEGKSSGSIIIENKYFCTFSNGSYHIDEETHEIIFNYNLIFTTEIPKIYQDYIQHY